jgi:CRP-like cAMP-binding protein
MMDQIEIVPALECCELFNGLEKSDIEKIAGLCQVETYKPGEYIFRQGELGECLYIIAEGHVFLERSIDLGPRKGNAVISILGKGSVLGCWSTLLDEPHNLMASATCQRGTTVVVMRGAELRDMMLKNIGLGINVFRKLCYILRDRLQGAFGAMEKI